MASLVSGASASRPGASGGASGGGAGAAPASACKDAGLQLVVCMERAPCVAQRQRTINECLAAGDVEGCEALRRGYFECRRGQLDMRARIHGRKHLDTGGGE